MSDYEIELNSLIIIQSLPENNPKDPKTGNNIFEIAKNLEHIHQSFDNRVQLIDIYTKNKFFEVLNEIVDQTENGLKPILHFEVHGNAESQNGLILEESRESISWDEIKPYFKRINIQMKNTLIVCLGVCYGQNCELQIDITDRSPFMLLIAPSSTIYPNQILDSFESFYNSIVFNNSLTDAMRLVKKKGTFKLIGSQFSIAHFRDITLNGIQTNNLRNDFIQRYQSNELLVLNQQTNNKMNWYISKMQNSIIDDYNKKRDYFLMLDLYPQQAMRYTESEIVNFENS